VSGEKVIERMKKQPGRMPPSGFVGKVRVKVRVRVRVRIRVRITVGVRILNSFELKINK
jgi:hypothetical protein